MKIKTNMVYKIKFHIKEIKKHRNKLRNLIEPINEVFNDVNESLELLEAGIDKLSEKI